MNTLVRTVMGLSLVALIAGPAAAQGRGGFGRGGGLAQLLGNASVQKELKLDDSQTEKAKALTEKVNEEMREKRQGLQDLSQEERQTKMQEINRESNAMVMKEAGEFLKPEQITRLHQISHQVRGAMAFSDPEVAKKLNLTDAQKTAIHEIGQEAREKMPSREDFQSDREAAMKKMQEVNKETLSKIEGKLNDEQQKTWKEMLGARSRSSTSPGPTDSSPSMSARTPSGRRGLWSPVRGPAPPVRKPSLSPSPPSRSHIHPGARQHEDRPRDTLDPGPGGDGRRPGRRAGTRPRLRRPHGQLQRVARQRERSEGAQARR